MAATDIERIPPIWDDARDSTFFGLVQGLFAPEFTHGASVLLASYDDVGFDTTAAPQKQHPPTLQ